MRVKVEFVPYLHSVGDVLRDVDAKGLVSETFLLVHGDLVCNVPLKDIVDKHKSIVKEDSDAIMTTLVRACNPFHRCRDRCEEAIFALDKKSSRILSYDLVDSEQTKSASSLSASLFLKAPQIDIRFDLLDCQVDVCSPQVSPLFQFFYEKI